MRCRRRNPEAVVKAVEDRVVLAFRWWKLRALGCGPPPGNISFHHQRFDSVLSEANVSEMKQCKRKKEAPAQDKCRCQESGVRRTYYRRQSCRRDRQILIGPGKMTGPYSASISLVCGTRPRMGGVEASICQQAHAVDGLIKMWRQDANNNGVAQVESA
jgi:hypothetical protein